MCNWNCLWFVFVYSSFAVLVIVGGQSTTDDQHDNVDQLADIVVRQQAELKRQQVELTKAVNEIEKLKAQLSTNRPRNPSSHEVQIGTSYVRWGRKTCESNASLVYTGHAAGPHWGVDGSGSNFLCLPDSPQWKNYSDGNRLYNGEIFGIQYNMYDTGTSRDNVFSKINNDGNPLHVNPASCAVCYAAGRSTIFNFPARTQCPDGWTMEYAGYLVSDRNHAHHKRSNYICLDEAPEVAVGGTAQTQVGAMYPVEVQCGSLPCSVYPNGRELTCIVCSK